jgi:hypothetical protein
VIPIDLGHLLALLIASARSGLYRMEECFYDERLAGYIVRLRHGADTLQQQTFTDYDDAVRWINKLAAWHAEEERMPV